LKDRFLPLLVPERQRPVANFVEALERFDEVAIEDKTSLLAVCEHVNADHLLQSNGLIHGPVLNPLELEGSEAIHRDLPARLQQIRWAKKTSHHLRAIGCHRWLSLPDTERVCC
jgi:hypothetical protein